MAAGASPEQVLAAARAGAAVVTVPVGQTWFNTQVLASGTLVVSGTAIGTSDGGVVNVGMSGITSATSVVDGRLSVNSGGTDFNATVGNGGVEIVFGVASGATIKAGSRPQKFTFAGTR